MTLRVRGHGPLLVDATSGNLIRAALPVRGAGQWYPMAEAANWLLGVGGALAYGTGSSAAVEQPYTAFAYAWPRSQHATWLWSVAVQSDANGSSGEISFSPGGDTIPYAVLDDNVKLFQFVHDPSSVAEGAIGVSLAPDDGDCSLVSWCVHELKRGFLETSGGSVGVHETSCTKGNPIYENTSVADKYASQGVWEQLRDAKTGSRRQALFHWHHQDGQASTATTFTGTSNVFEISPAIQTRNMANGGGTTANVKWAFLAKTTGGNAEARITMTTGATQTVTITSTSAVWHTPAAFAIETDDLSQSNTIRGGTRDTATIEIRRTTGTEVTIYGVSIGEAT